jgi:hypothetical protein
MGPPIHVQPPRNPLRPTWSLLPTHGAGTAPKHGGFGATRLPHCAGNGFALVDVDDRFAFRVQNGPGRPSAAVWLRNVRRHANLFVAGLREEGGVPPSTGKLCPTTNDAASEQSQTTTSATSSGRPICPIGCFAVMTGTKSGMAATKGSTLPSSVRVPWSAPSLVEVDRSLWRPQRVARNASACFSSGRSLSRVAASLSSFA